jgi:hypothetical protein
MNLIVDETGSTVISLNKLLTIPTIKNNVDQYAMISARINGNPYRIDEEKVLPSH